MDCSNRADYLDEADAMRRLAGNKAIYTTLLKKYKQGDHFTPIETALSSRDLKEAAVAAHALKGLSANLSLPKVRALSAQIEEMCKQGEMTGLPLAELQEALDITGSFIDGFLEGK